MVGRVVSTKMQKTAVVLTEGQKEHPLYGKRYLRSKRYLVDDPFGVKDGDIVVFLKVKPISKHKHWQITKVLGQDFVSLQEAELKVEAEGAIAQVLPEEKESTDDSLQTTEKQKETVDSSPKTVDKKPKKATAKKIKETK